MSTSEPNSPPSPHKPNPAPPVPDTPLSASKPQREVAIFFRDDSELREIHTDNHKLRRQLAEVAQYAEKELRRKDAQLERYKEKLRRVELESVQVEMRQDIKMQIRKMQVGALRRGIGKVVSESAEMGAVEVILKMLEDMEAI